MAINKKIIHFKKKEDFDNEVANGNILDRSIVFIQDSKEISTHGTVYKTVNWSVLEPLYEWVDLGLPSGTLWADRNVGATKPEGFGLYFAWGETDGYYVTKESNSLVIKDKDGNDTNAKSSGFNFADYKLCNGSSTSLTKYCTNSYEGTVDNKMVLEQVDDAAYQSDNTCRMPTSDECQELIDNTTSAWTTDYNGSGVSGIVFTSKADTTKSIFIPAAGLVVNGSLLSVGSYVYLWSSSLRKSSLSSINAWYVYFGSSNVSLSYNPRTNGYSVRPVKSKS